MEWTVLDGVLVAVAITGGYASTKVFSIFARDVMKTTFGFIAAAFVVLGAGAATDAVARALGLGWSSVLLLAVTGLVACGLTISGLAFLLRWASVATRQ